MSKTNNIKQAVLDAEQLKNAIKEESKETLKLMLNEAVKDAIREAVKEDDGEEYEVVDDENTPTTDTEDNAAAQTEAPAEAPAETPVDASDEAPAEDNADEWSEFSQYQVGDDNTYDLTGVKDYEEIAKVYKLMNGSDELVIKQEGDSISLADNETGKEYVIDLGMNGDESVEGEGEDITESVIKEAPDDDIAGIPDTEDEISEDDFEIDLDNNEPTFGGKEKQKIMKENKEMLFEIDLGYTDNYQDKDPIQGLSNTEPSKSGKSWEKGVPTGTEKPWAGDSKSKGEPFEKTVNEEENDSIVDENVTVSKSQKRKSPKTKASNSGDVNAPEKSRHISVGSDYKEIAEAYKKQNAELKKVVKELNEHVKEAYIVNNSLAKITRLFTENTVTQDERREIVNRFANEAKTIEQSNKLYESIDKQLKKNVITLESTSKPMNAESVKAVNENKVYKSNDLLNTLDLIKRMQNC